MPFYEDIYEWLDTDGCFRESTRAEINNEDLNPRNYTAWAMRTTAENNDHHYNYYDAYEDIMEILGINPIGEESVTISVPTTVNIFKMNTEITTPIWYPTYSSDSVTNYTTSIWRYPAKIGLHVRGTCAFDGIDFKDKEGYVVSFENPQDYLSNFNNSVGTTRLSYLTSHKRMFGVLFDTPIYKNNKRIGRQIKINGKEFVIVYIPAHICEYETEGSLDCSGIIIKKYNETDFEVGKIVHLKSIEELERNYGRNCFGNINTKISIADSVLNKIINCDLVITNVDKRAVTVADIDTSQIYRLSHEMFMEYQEEELDDITDKAYTITKINEYLLAHKSEIKTYLFHWVDLAAINNSADRDYGTFIHSRQTCAVLKSDNEEAVLAFQNYDITYVEADTEMPMNEFKTYCHSNFKNLEDIGFIPLSEIVPCIRRSSYRHKWNFLNSELINAYGDKLYKLRGYLNADEVITEVPSPMATMLDKYQLCKYSSYIVSRKALLSYMDINAHRAVNGLMLFKIPSTAWDGFALFWDFNKIIED